MADRLTEQEIAELRALCESTHDGEVGARLEWLQAQTAHQGTDGSTAACMERLWRVARAARTALPRLLAELGYLRPQYDAAKAYIESADEVIAGLRSELEEARALSRNLWDNFTIKAKANTLENANTLVAFNVFKDGARQAEREGRK